MNETSETNRKRGKVVRQRCRRPRWGGGSRSGGGKGGGAVNAGSYRDIALIGCYSEVEFILLRWYKSAYFTRTKVQMLMQKLTRYLRTCLLLVLQERDMRCKGGGVTLWGGGKGQECAFSVSLARLLFRG
jgi:hypothetical protein